MAPYNGINDEDGALLSSISTDDDESVRKRKTIKQLSVSTAHSSEYSHNFNQGNQEEILRTIRAAGVKFIRVAYFLAFYLRANFIPVTFVFLPVTYIFQHLICLCCLCGDNTIHAIATCILDRLFYVLSLSDQ